MRLTHFNCTTCMIEVDARSFRLDRQLAVGLVAIALSVLALQLSSLFIFPQPNGLRWFGDETWLMSEAKSQITTGVVRYPLALGSTLEQSKGLVLSMTWLSSCLYGAPSALIPGDPIEIGRSVTAALGVLLCASLFVCARKLGASHSSAALAVLLLVCSRSFFYSSHSCRTDLLAGLIVLVTVTLLMLRAKQSTQPSGRWWLLFGAVIAFLSVSSSVHLLTLLLPVSTYFVWRLGALSRSRNVYFALAGSLAVFIILVSAYYVAIGNLTLFTPTSAGHSQFHDVLSSIPILRPFSRSVQVSNLVIRMKQIAIEAPQVYLIVPLLAVAMRSSRQRLLSPSSIAFPISIVICSWLFLEGSEVNYLVQILPLLLLAVAILFSRLTEHSPRIKYSLIVLLALSVGGLGVRDALPVRSTARNIDRSNERAIAQIGSAVAQTWRGKGKPRVCTEPTSLSRLSQISSIETMTDHFISFPTREEPLDSFILRHHIDYFVLYDSPTYPKNRQRDDPFYREVVRLGSLEATIIGTSGDVGRDHFCRSDWMDTLLLFRINYGGK